MALFGFGDISFNKGLSGRRGPLASLEQSNYSVSTLRYPLDIGNADKGHYMIFYIKKQEASQASDENTPTSFVEAINSATKNSINSSIDSLKTNFSNELSSGIQNATTQINNFSGNAFGGLTNSIGNSLKKITGSISNFSNPFGQSISFNANGAVSQEINRNNIKSLVGGGDIVRGIKKTTRTGQVIALYMPDTLQFDYTQDYESLSLGATAAGIAGGSAAGSIGQEGQGAFTTALKSIPAVIQAEANKRLGAIGALGGFLATGAVVNPLLEVLYRAPQFRSFQYDFIFYPRDEREAVEVQKIINSLQYHQAPEFKQGSAGSLLIPPSEFDIEFYYGGKKNPNLPVVGNCVLKSIQVNYAPNGFSAYEVPGQNATVGGTGMPVAIQVSLQFQETTYLTKNGPGDPPAPSKSTDELPELLSGGITGNESAFSTRR